MSNTKINYTFGILSGGGDKLRHSTCVPSMSQKKLLGPLWYQATDKEALAEFLIRFLRCSEAWPKYCNEFDEINTYHIAVDLSDFGIKFSDLIKWSDECQHKSDVYPVYSSQTAVDRIANRLFGILTIK